MKRKCKLMLMILFTVVLCFQGVFMVSAQNDVTIILVNDKELSVDFSNSGELPEEKQVTIYIPEEATYFFNDGDDLYLYYNNPETGLKEYIGEGRCTRESGVMGKLFTSFNMDHSGEYIITYEYQGESYDTIKEEIPVSLYIVAAIFFAMCIVVGVLINRRLKQKKALVPADIWYDPTVKTDKFKG